MYWEEPPRGWASVAPKMIKGESITNGTSVHGFTNAHRSNGWLPLKTLVGYAHTAGRPLPRILMRWSGILYDGSGCGHTNPQTMTRVLIHLQVCLSAVYRQRLTSTGACLPLRQRAALQQIVWPPSRKVGQPREHTLVPEAPQNDLQPFPKGVGFGSTKMEVEGVGADLWYSACIHKCPYF